MEEDELDGSYKGSRRSFVRVDSKKGYAILECQYCGERVPGNWDNADQHTCGAGTDGEYSCCDEMELEDTWITHSETETRTFKERKKQCVNCNELFELGNAPSQ